VSETTKRRHNIRDAYITDEMIGPNVKRLEKWKSCIDLVIYYHHYHHRNAIHLCMTGGGGISLLLFNSPLSPYLIQIGGILRR